MYRHTGLVIGPKHSGTIDGAVNKTGAATLNCGMVTVWCVRLRISSRVSCLAALRSSTFVGDFSRFIASSPITVYSPGSRNESLFCTYRQCFAPEGSCRPFTKSLCCRPCTKSCSCTKSYASALKVLSPVRGEMPFCTKISWRRNVCTSVLSRGKPAQKIAATIVIVVGGG